jgi:hypothetical protein
MSALLIDNEVKARLKALRQLAEANVTSLAEMSRRASGGDWNPTEGNAPFTIGIPMNYTVTFTVEEQKPPVGICRHLSVGLVGRPNRVPTKFAMRTIMKEFGFINDVDTCYLWTEPTGGGTIAVNVIEPLDGKWPEPLVEQAKQPRRRNRKWAEWSAR